MSVACKANDNKSKPHFPIFNIIDGQRVLCCSRCGKVLESGDLILSKRDQAKWRGYDVTDQGELK